MLYLISTPIGNLGDFTFRAIKTIESCDYLLCEDTRRSKILLDHYELKKPLKSFHKFNEKGRLEGVLADLREGKTIGLLSDAGTPCIADPGFELVAKCRQEGLQVFSIPGASAIATALCASGFDASRFQFLGFLPKKTKALKEFLTEALNYSGTTVFFESPYRIKATLKVLDQLDCHRQIAVARELTKKFESYYFGTSKDLLELWKDKPPKGECILLITGRNK